MPGSCASFLDVKVAYSPHYGLEEQHYDLVAVGVLK